MSDSFGIPWTILARLLGPWDFPGKNTGVDCHFLLQGNLLDPGIELSLALAGGYFITEPPEKLIRETDTRPITLEINPEMPGLCIRIGIRPMNSSFGFYLKSRC